MDEKTKAALASGLAGGYVLGRTKKGKLALSVAMFLAGRNISLEPRQLAAQAVRRLGEMPQVAGVQKQIRAEGVDAARGAVTAVANRGVGSLADAIGKRALDLRSKGEEDGSADDAEAGAEDTEDVEDAEQGEDEEEEAEDEGASPAGRGRRGPGKDSTESAGRRKAPPAKKTAPAKKKASQAPARKAGARRTTAQKKTADEPSSGRASKNTSSRAQGRR
ncbi:histone protein [Streptomyces sp. NPDC059166]|uniref:histone protein n=1 Tax=Streptomyces sp. NPDC059166 TaxID=3346752 RepID=UPI0036B73A51